MKKAKLLFVAFAIATLNFGPWATKCSAQYTKLMDFSSTDGSGPDGALISDGTFFYGLTSAGGANNMGVIFKIMPDGTGYTKLYEFIGGPTDGKFPEGSLFSDGTFLYGMTWKGGANDKGIVFKIKPDGTSYSKIYDFLGGTDGEYPYYSTLISDGTFLFGMTSKGGTYSVGTIFKIMPDGTGYSKMLDFDSINGGHPYGSLIYDGTFLYGMAHDYGYPTNNIGYNHGAIFKIKPDGTGYSQLYRFLGTPDGANPKGGLFSDGTYLYGTGDNCALYQYGHIFKIKLDGTGYTKLFDFSNSTTGGLAYGNLISDGTFLYGTTNIGTANGAGGIYKIKLDGTGFTHVFDFKTTDGENPYGSLFLDGSSLYGMTAYGGTNGMGVMFKCSVTNGSGGSTGIEQYSTDNSISIFPNPSTGIFTLQSPTKISSIEVTNTLGILILTQQVNTNKAIIDLSKELNGNYFVKIISDETTTAKLILNR